jgi:hypothetical protein
VIVTSGEKTKLDSAAKIKEAEAKFNELRGYLSLAMLYIAFKATIAAPGATIAAM